MRKEEDASETEFRPNSPGGPYRVEIEIQTDDELRALKRDGKLIAVRMSGIPKGKTRQVNLVAWQEIKDFGW